MDGPKCRGCRSVINDRKYLSCLECKHKYDLQCANLSPKRFKGMNDESKRKWRCLECKSKVPKMDNTNTPVRPLDPHKSSAKVDSDNECLSDNSNITHRKKPDSGSNYIVEEKLAEILKADRQETRSLLQNSISSLSNQLVSIQNQCTDFQKSLSYVSEKHDDTLKEIAGLKKLLSIATTELKTCKEENQNLRDRIKALEEDNLKQQQWSRMQNIEVTGIPESKDEDTTEIVVKVAQLIGVPVQATDIEFAHRVQPRRATGTASTARPIIVRLRQRAIKDRIVADARKHRNLTASQIGLGGEANKIFINEHLTKENKMLLSLCKQKAKEANFKFVWTKNCRIYVRKNESSPPIPISSSLDIQRIV